MENELIKKQKRNKKAIIIGIATIVIILLGTSYAFFTFFKSIEAFTITSGDVTATFTDGTNIITYGNAYPISDEYALDNLDRLTYAEFTVESNITNPNHSVAYEIYLTEESGNTLNNEYIKVYLTDENNKRITSPSKYSDLPYTTYAPDKNTGRVIRENNNVASSSKTYRLYIWLAKEYTQNEVNQIFSFKVNVYAYNSTLEYLRVASNTNATGTFLNSDLIKNTIEKITFTNTKKVPNDAIGSFDASANQNKSIMAWYYDTDGNGLYEVYIGGDGGVYANSNSSRLFSYLTALKEIDLTYFKVTNVVTDMSYMFINAINLTNLDLSNWNTSSVTTMASMFASTINLINILDLSNWDTSNVTNMSHMFNGVSSLRNLDLSNWDTSKVASMVSMFFDASNLINVGDLSNWNTSNVIFMTSMFYNATSLIVLDLSEWNTSKVTTMTNMFYNASSLTTLDLSKWDTSKVTSMSSMFSGSKNLTNLDLSSANFASVTNFPNMFNSTNASLKVTVKDQAAYDFISPLLTTTQRALLTIKS